MSAPTAPNSSTSSAPASGDLLTVEQAADALQMSQSAIRSYIRQGTITASRIAGKRALRIARAELMKLLEPAR